MAALQTKTFEQIVQDQATAVQGSATRAPADFSVGSILRAVIEASGAVVMWLQGLILQLLSTTRAATAAGADLDTWMADYNLFRLPAVAGTGTVTFSRFTASVQAIVSTGTIVQTADGKQQFVVIADTGQAAYNPGTGYVLPIGTASVSATVQAINAGSISNVAANVINTLGQTISGVDTVNNNSAFVTGADAETDADFRARFVNYLASLSKATKSAIGNAIASIQKGLSYTLTEDYTYTGVYQPGYFYVVVDDGTGSPPSGLLASVTTAIDAVRAAGITFGVFPPTPINANVSATITSGAGYIHATVVAAVQSAITAYIANLPMGVGLNWSRLYQIAYDASPGVVEVTSLMVNGATADLVATAQNAVVPGAITVS